MKKLLLFLFFGLFLFTTVEMEAQIISEAAARAEIRKRGLDEDEVLLELKKKGIDLENIDLNNPAELAKAETALREVIAELEAKKNSTSTSGASEENSLPSKTEEVSPVPTTEIPLEELNKEEAKDVARESEDVVEKVEEGATIEEAVAETLQETAEEKLPPATTYGQEIFRNKTLSVFRQSDNARPPGTYVLGPGDKIAINIWGISEESSAFEINSEGFIKPSLLPRIYLTGLTIEEAKKRLQSFYSRSYRFRDEDFDVTLSTARTITVNIVGEVENSGSYTISALNTAFNALVAAGGPSKLGSVRNIQLISGSDVKEIDVYAFLQNPSISQNLYLKDGDYINVPVARKVVTISGAVNRPTNYELKDNEGLNELIDYAAGLTNRAIRKTMKLIRIENDEEVLVDIPYGELQAAGRNFDLRSGDRIQIFSLPLDYNNFVNLSGAFLVPGEYAYEEGMRVSDLINKTEFLDGAILDSAYLRRVKEDDVTVTYQVINLRNILDDPTSTENLILRPKDGILLRRIQEFAEQFSVSINGAVRKPGDYAVDKSGSLKVSDLVFLSGGLQEGANEIGYISRVNPDNPFSREYIKVNVRQAINDVNGSENLVLQGGDQLTVYSKSKFLDPYSVSVSGAVREPGEFQADKSEAMKISDLVFLSGGLIEDADDIGYISRINPDNPLSREYIRVNVRLAINDTTNNENLILQGGDQLTVFPKSRYMDQFSVSLSGAVRNPGDFTYDPSLTLNDLITLAGGLTIEAAPSRIEVYRVKIERDKETEILAATLGLDEDNKLINQDFSLQPYDKIYVRSAPEFELQRLVTVSGEVKYPGQYAILDDNETINSIIQRAGGVTEEAFLGGASLFRNLDDLGFVVFDFEKAMDDPRSNDNVILQSGDDIQVPKMQKLVTIIGATKAIELYPEDVVNSGRFNVPFKPGKNAKYYIDEFAGGIAKNGDAGKVSVTYANGELQKSGRFLFWRTYPEVKEGSIIKVGVKDIEPPKLESESEDEKVNWGEVVANGMAQATALLSLILLVQRLD